MDAIQQYDAIVIGSGQGGTPLSIALAAAGRKTAMIERIHVGGTCINEGCTPTKTMVASGRVAYLVRRSQLYGVHHQRVPGASTPKPASPAGNPARQRSGAPPVEGQTSVTMSEVRERKQAIVESFRSSGERRLENGQVDLIRGEARFTAPKCLEVKLNGSGKPIQLSAETIFINTGARPADPPLPGLESVPHLNSTTIMELDELPEHLLVLGGGYVGLEFGQMFRRFGSEVTIVQRGPQLMGREDADIADAVADILREDGIEILLNSSADRVEQLDGTIRLVAGTPDGERTLSGSHLLVAAGRSPNSEALNLGAAGVERDKRGFVVVNDRLETSVPGIYALGDVAGSPAFTHISYDDFRILRANLLEGGERSRKDRLVPYTMFIDPQLGRVGLSEEEARAEGRNFRVAKIPMNYVARALEVDESRGMVKAIVDADTGHILGCAVLGIEGGEIMAMMEIAMLGKLPYTVLRDAVFAHPTLAELLNTLFATLDAEHAAEREMASASMG